MSDKKTNLPSLVLGHCPAESLREIIFLSWVCEKLAVQMFFFILGRFARACGIAPHDFLLFSRFKSNFRSVSSDKARIIFSVSKAVGDPAVAEVEFFVVVVDFSYDFAGGPHRDDIARYIFCDD